MEQRGARQQRRGERQADEDESDPRAGKGVADQSEPPATCGRGRGQESPAGTSGCWVGCFCDGRLGDGLVGDGFVGDARVGDGLVGHARVGDGGGRHRLDRRRLRRIVREFGGWLGSGLGSGLGNVRDVDIPAVGFGFGVGRRAGVLRGLDAVRPDRLGGLVDDLGVGHACTVSGALPQVKDARGPAATRIHADRCGTMGR